LPKSEEAGKTSGDFIFVERDTILPPKCCAVGQFFRFVCLFVSFSEKRRVIPRAKYFCPATTTAILFKEKSHGKVRFQIDLYGGSHPSLNWENF
jgi:hypothetical protein